MGRNKLKALRLKNCMQQEELSELTGIKVSRLRTIEKCFNEAKIKELKAIAKVFNIKVQDLL